MYANKCHPNIYQPWRWRVNQSTSCIRIKTCRDCTLLYIILMYALLHTACQCDLCTTQVQIVYKHLIHGCDFSWTLNTVIKHSVLHEGLVRNATEILTIYFISFDNSVLFALVNKQTSLYIIASSNQNIL